MSFLHHQPEEGRSGAVKFVVLALSVLAILGAVAFWFLRQAPEPAVGTPRAEGPTPAIEPAPPEEAEPEAPSAEADVAGPGSISITATVDGASVYLDGELIGEAPVTRENVPAGRHRIRVEGAGHEPFETEVRIRAGARESVEVSLARLAPSLRVDSDVPGATVFLDRNYIGTTPVDIKDVSPGEHQLTVSADGYDMHAETVTVESGPRDILVSFKNVALSERIAVVHKHRMGSCEGNLIADNAGLRYETANKNDGFAAPFASLDQFELDYIEKNLNLKVRKGKNYNFAEKSGNADALFVFHKNVQAYREKN
ncbi:MAG TPA: PEGA domain-containing protein [Vicinamibacteria bacterium]|nr:PEGA domain-containing protein [Vicinamibacteria bacterium]